MTDVTEPLPVDATTRIRPEAERQVTDRAVLHEILDAAVLAHVGVVRDGLPLVLPFACARDGDTLLLHGSTGSGPMRLAISSAAVRRRCGPARPRSWPPRRCCECPWTGRA